MKLKIVLSLLLFGSFLTSYGQREVQRDNFIWATYTLAKPLNNNVSLSLMIQSRRYAFPDRQHQSLFSLGLAKTFDSKLSIGGGFTYFLQALAIDRSDVEVVRPELRPYQHIGYGSEMGRWSLSHRLMLEERWFRNTQGDELVDGYTFFMRVRYRFMMQTSLNESGTWKGVFSLEPMFNAANPDITNVFDQNRIYAGLKHNLSGRLALDFGYLYWYQQFPDVNNFASFHIINLALTHTLK